MSVVQEACPSCAAPLDIPASATKFKCPYCSTSLAVQRHGSEVALAIGSALTSSIEKSGTQTQEAIKEGSYVTQTELRRLQISQDLSMAQMRLSNVQGEIRSIERLPVTPVTRNQLVELRASEADLKRQIKTLSDILNPPPPTATSQAVPERSVTTLNNGRNIAWLLFSPTGRISRSQYWIGVAVLAVIFFVIGITSPGTADAATGEAASPAGFCSTILMLLFLWIGFAVSAKRYHDRGKPLWWVFIVLIPVIGFFWQIIELGFLPGDPGANQYS